MVEEPIRVAVVDDQRLFASGLAMLLEAQPDMVCVGMAEDGDAAVELATRERPNVVLMDLRMPNVNGLEATHRILGDTAIAGPPKVVVLTTIKKDEAVYSALRAGASAFLTKDAAPAVVLETIRATAAGLPAPTQQEALELVRDFAPPVERAKPDPLLALTTREREIFALVAQGLSNTEIAQTHFVSEATVKSHVRSLLIKLHMRSRIQVVIFAYENDLAAPAGGNR